MSLVMHPWAIAQVIWDTWYYTPAQLDEQWRQWLKEHRP